MTSVTETSWLRQHTDKNMAPENNASINDSDINGRYANYLKVGFNAFEFVLDFSQQFSENEKLAWYTRIITNPVYAKAFSEVLRKSVEQYENVYGTISEGN